MDSAILPSTLLLTLLLSVGLFFFIRASTKDRTTKAQLVSQQDEATLMPKLKEYFRSRSYQVAAIDPEKNQVVFEGFVQPSRFLAVFLTLLTSAGMICLSLVLSLLFPNFGKLFLPLVLLSPLSGLFYWKKAGRLEKVSLQMEEASQCEFGSPSKITIVAHRDELMELQRALELKSVD
ncbi:cofactor assembly of complex C subunit B [Umezakia ovalisporum]|uniref:Cofactor assembly of complex C subunit B n=2 Tax=Umezakia ovalisporum TaxID=75695 RepID=A0AA43GVD3_9CYAN|nr:cofactor assembly of complex C subunit B [Umezakia ovalisporum]MDH6055247.1 cofactor assembly of complex C subunit B [Umezakia ovalisporum FSS-43]MDH6062449.1 cofactor assembly of complex C subunit B [Umezakia ovalisporum FSS-62]MDH6070006.1 cofactor assembly of complex C subunit B [Umezakia ovalisporum CobakiLakeA]MDH6080737.1 cofactor assembly of complex C subunit B [Umezakia ovalisporum FSS-44]MDH6095117.1 cofactor assembly of complex C subunit B [Umezakia ovalisporum CobakiLakeB]